MNEPDADIPTEVQAAAIDALRAAVAKDPTPVAVHVRVLADHGDGALYFACFLWGELLSRVVAEGREESAAVQLEFCDPAGRRLDPDDQTALPASTVWAARFLAAVVARDTTMAMALFNACRRRADFVDKYVMRLLETVSRGLQPSQA